MSTWADQSGNHFDASQSDDSKKPTLARGNEGLNGHQAIKVTAPTGTADSFLQGTVDFGGDTTTTGMTAIYVVQHQPYPDAQPPAHLRDRRFAGRWWLRPPRLRR